VCALRRLFLRLVPLSAAELVQRRRIGRRTAVAADQMQTGYRHIQLGVVRVQQVQEFVRSIAEIERREPEVASDTVLLVHDRIADAHFRQIAQHRIDVAAPRVALAGPAHDTRIKLGLGDQRDVRLGPDETGMERTCDQRRARVAGDELGPVGDHCRLESVFGEILLHGFTAAEALRRDQYALGGGGHMAFERAQRIVGAAIDLDWRRECVACPRRDPPACAATVPAAGAAASASLSTTGRSVALSAEAAYSPAAAAASEASSIRANGLSTRWNSSSGTNSSFGASSGRARSPRNSR
jgi:hypothetical protein